MSNSVIKIENLSKCYRIGEHVPYKTIRESLVNFCKAPFRWSSVPGLRSSSDMIWALKNVFFEVKQGDVIGIIGRNGAGKSTLLKILSKITEPTEGRVELRGRVGSLLEIGTGFHPELTGHENIYLYGAILGMDRWEITRKFNEIVAFAELEMFIDTPVKRYSSGMYMRLAFAVAAHLEPEILLIDEVLAVGDASFQKKCLGKMENVSSSGRTVLFVSHNMGAIRNICKKTILLQNGMVSDFGPTDQVIAKYMSTVVSLDLSSKQPKIIEVLPRTKGNGIIKITKLTLLSQSGNYASSFYIWEPMIIEMGFHCSQIPISASFWILVMSSDGTIVLSAFQYDSGESVKITFADGKVRVHIDPNGLMPGLYSLSVGAFSRHNEFYDWVDNVISFEIKKEFFSGKFFDERLGQTSHKYRWEML